MIRTMRREDVSDVSRIVLDSFLHSVSSHLSEQGIATFRTIASEKAFLERMSEENTMLVYESAGAIHGYVEVKEGRHLALLFVDPAKQRKGVGAQLVAEALKYCTGGVVTVNASLNSVGTYLGYGFEIAGPEAELQGLRFRPMMKKTQ
ncbi:MAG: GNAT family N-acetyltransferase [Gammaproteobacteria bacterium]|nr:GNAT family N-acetyltransferase [Gammaproteobacteria bacterium]